MVVLINKEFRFVVYMLVCPITKQVRYVGKSANVKQRYKQHCKDLGTETLKKKWISYLSSKYLTPNLVIVSSHQTEEAARIAENETCIKHIATVFNIFMPGKNTPTCSDYRKMKNIKHDTGNFIQTENKATDKYNKL